MRPGVLFAAVLVLTGCRTSPPHLKAVRQAGGGTLTNPLLDLDSDLEFTELRPFRRKLGNLIEEPLSSGAVRHVSVYFRDLNNGPSLGINEKEPFSPASLFKVPIMMAILKEAEASPALLQQRVVDADEDDSGKQNIPPSRRVETGRSYTVGELLHLMITTSDNRAHNLLLGYLDRKVFGRVFADLGLAAPDIKARDASMRVKDYATFFRILYNASYLSREMSEKALRLLSESEYKNGLVAGVPAGTVVAHKFGERAYPDHPERQLHDCGIVYHPRTPYVLCVMTRGESLPALEAVIRDASALVYKEVDAQSGGSKKP